MKILSHEEIQSIKDAVKKLPYGLLHYRNNWDKGFKVGNGFTEEQENAGYILNKFCTYHQLDYYKTEQDNESMLEKYLLEQEKLADIVNVIYKYDMSLEELKINFDKVLKDFESKIEAQQREFERKSKALTQKSLKEFT